MKMIQQDAFDATKPLTADMVDSLTMPQLMQRLEIVNAQAGQSLEVGKIIARVPSVRGVLSALDAGRGQTNELSIILGSIQRRANVIGDALKNLEK